MTIVFNSLNVSGVINLRQTSADGTSASINLTGMTLEARFFDVGHVGQYPSNDYGSTGTGDTALLTVSTATSATSTTDGGVVVDDAEAGQIHYVITPAQALSLQQNSIVAPAGRRRMQVEIWRTDSGAGSRFAKFTEWAEG